MSDLLNIPTEETKTSGVEHMNHITTNQQPMNLIETTKVIETESQLLFTLHLTDLSTFIPFIQTNIIFLTAKDILTTVLRTGIVVIKHGRSGNPKRKLLRCDNDFTKLTWQDAPLQRNESFSGSIRSNLSSISLTRTPSTIKLKIPKNDDFIFIDDIQSIRLGSEVDSTTNSKKTLVGTEVFRRNKITSDQSKRCFSLICHKNIVNDKLSLDIECQKAIDFHFLYQNLSCYLKFNKK